MNFGEWSKSNADYGRKLVKSGLEGARSGRETFLNGESLAPFLGESIRHALAPTALGVCIGVLGGYSGNRHKSAGRALAYGLVGAAIGFGAGVAWQTRRLAASVATGAVRGIEKVRDEHWLEHNPIDYA
jgi:hypothetical protein